MTMPLRRTDSFPEFLIFFPSHPHPIPSIPQLRIQLPTPKSSSYNSNEPRTRGAQSSEAHCGQRGKGARRARRQSKTEGTKGGARDGLMRAMRCGPNAGIRTRILTCIFRPHRSKIVGVFSATGKVKQQRIFGNCNTLFGAHCMQICYLSRPRARSLDRIYCEHGPLSLIG